MVLAAAGIWYISGGRVYSVQTNSMQPVFAAGDAIIAGGLEYEIRIGDIVSYYDRDQPHLVLTHRVIASSDSVLTTKGDANPQPDLPIQRNQVISRAVIVAPSLGRVMDWLKRPLGLLIGLYIPAIIVTVGILLRHTRTGHSVYHYRS